MVRAAYKPPKGFESGAAVLKRCDIKARISYAEVICGDSKD